MPDRGRVQVQPGGDDQDGERADRHVDVEDPAPREVVDEEAAEQRPGDRCDSEDGADQAHVAPSLPRRDDVGDDRLRPDHQSSGADPLQCAEADQLAHRLREPGQHRSGEEDQDRREEERLAADHVAELAVHRSRDRRGEQVGGHHPREVVEPAQVANDRRERGRNDRLIERGQEHPEHQRCENGPQRSSGQPPLLGNAQLSCLPAARASWARVSGGCGRAVAASARRPSSKRPR